jgi:hypothetical protein
MSRRRFANQTCKANFQCIPTEAKWNNSLTKINYIVILICC